jgi:hypothetical protein
LLSSFSFSSVVSTAAAVVVGNPAADKPRPLAHRADRVAAVLPRADLARDLEPGREGDEALVVVPVRKSFLFFSVSFLFFGL